MHTRESFAIVPYLACVIKEPSFKLSKKIVMAILGSDAVRSRVFWLNCSEFFNRKGHTSVYNGILFPKLFCPTVRKSCSSDQEKLLDSRLKAENIKSF